MAVISTILVPNETVNDDMVIVASLKVENGSQVNRSELVAELETSKTTIEVISPCDGYIEFYCKLKDELRVGSAFALIHDKTPDFKNEDIEKSPTYSPSPSPSPSPSADINTLADETENNTTIFSKLAEEMVQRHGIDKRVFAGRSAVRTRDVAAHMKDNKTVLMATKSYSPRNTIQKQSATLGALPDNLSKIYKTTTISRAKQSEIDILSMGQNLLTSNLSIKIQIPKTVLDNDGHPNIFGNLKSQLIPSLLISVCTVLKKHPILNAFFYEGEINYYETVQLGYAIDLGNGLAVVNLGDIGNQSNKEINDVIFVYVRQYMANTIPPSALRGCTFTVTDLASEEVTGFTPLINHFQSAILGVSAIDPKGQFIGLTLTFDHRVTEGRQAAQFLKELKSSVESRLRDH